VLDALPLRAGDIARASDEPLDQRRLSDTGFAGNPNHRALSAARFIPGSVKAA
jgi:hypothetical protein